MYKRQDYNKVPWALPHVYDYMEGRDAESFAYPLMGEVYKRRRYLTSYGKMQKKEFDGIIVERNAMPDSYSGVVSVSEKIVTLGDSGSAAYNFTVEESGVYDIAVNIGFPFWDKNSLYLSLDGASQLYEESRLWWPYWRTTFWKKAWSGVSLSAGSHTLTVSVSAPGVQVYGFKVCRSFTESTVCGAADYLLSPRKFKDINGVMLGPREGFKLTFEMLRRKADLSLIHILAQYAKPKVSYVLNAMDLSVLTGFEHEAWSLGDYVRVEDKELGLSVTTRTVSYTHLDVYKRQLTRCPTAILWQG